MIKFFLVGYDQRRAWPICSVESKLTVSQEWTDGNSWFLHAGKNSHKLKGDWKSLGQAWSKMGMINLMMGLWNWLSGKWIDGITWFFACW